MRWAEELGMYFAHLSTTSWLLGRNHLLSLPLPLPPNRPHLHGLLVCSPLSLGMSEVRQAARQDGSLPWLGAGGSVGR